jgi:hypothetical protein
MPEKETGVPEGTHADEIASANTTSCCGSSRSWARPRFSRGEPRSGAGYDATVWLHMGLVGMIATHLELSDSML